ncbi:MAG: hypothetical protein ACRDOD_22055, partial [Streptosporangiaceae bacterium]
MRSTERIARQAYEQLPARDKALVMSWRDLGNSWCDSLLNSGVLSRSGRRVRPDDAARAVENERFDQTMLDRQRRMAPIDENVRMREAAEHE